MDLNLIEPFHFLKSGLPFISLAFSILARLISLISYPIKCIRHLQLYSDSLRCPTLSQCSMQTHPTFSISTDGRRSRKARATSLNESNELRRQLFCRESQILSYLT